MAKIWLDIPALEDLDAQTSMGRRLAAPSFAGYGGLKDLIAAYHLIVKTDIGLFEVRRGKLQEIANHVAEQFPNAEIKNKFASKAYEQVRGLRTTAVRKRDYLQRLLDYFARNESERAAPARLFQSILDKRHASEDLKGLRAEYIMESVDPLHRNFLFNAFDDGRVTAGNSSQTVAFAQWYASGMQIPFFAYLEGTAHCLGEGSEDYVVAYQGEQGRQREAAKIFVAYFSDRGVDAVDLSEADIPVSHPFDCQAYEFKGSKGATQKALAYAWTEEKLIFLGNHGEVFEAGKVQHSSLAQGQPVRCAGMLSGRNGKIVYVDNNSGHFAPTGGQLRKFVAEIRQQGAFDLAARVGEVQPDHSVKVCALGEFR